MMGDLTIEDKEIAKLKPFSDNEHFKSTLMIAKLGDLFCQDKKEKNDWKKRMLMAGLENRGLSMPDDWNELSEDEKESRLNKVMELMK